MSKYGFSDVITLHAAISPPTDTSFVGTEIHLRGVTQEEMVAAKDFFLRFSQQTILEETPYGHIIRRDPRRPARIYVTGLLVAEEDNFAFSYNITSPTAPMRRALNRERTNVGRTAYTDRVKAMLLMSKAGEIASTLAEDLVRIEQGTQHDEVQWSDVAVHACQSLNTSRKVLFVTAAELAVSRDAVDQARFSELCPQLGALQKADGQNNSLCQADSEHSQRTLPNGREGPLRSEQSYAAQSAFRSRPAL
jgi:hypothetical protein